MKWNRREFIGMAACAVGAAAADCRADSARAGKGRVPKDGDIRSLYLGLGNNMWCDWYPEGFDTSSIKEGLPDTKLRCNEAIWRQVTDHAASIGINQIVVDVGEGLQYPRRPELAIEGSWSAEKLAAEVDRLHALGVEVIPKLNFSTTHNGWLKHYRRMVGSPEYYRVCEDVLKDVHEVCGEPRYVHIGCDEEDGEWHVMRSQNRKYIVVRRGEVWKHDFLHLVKTVEGLGARAWAWADYGWDCPEFLQWCPKSVLLSNWYYDECHGGFDLATNKTSDHKRLRLFWQLEEAGFDQVPCGTNWVGWQRKKDNCGADDVIGKLVKTCRKAVSSEHLKGFLMAPWTRGCVDDADRDEINRGADLLMAALVSRD